MTEPPPYRDSCDTRRRPMRATWYFKNNDSGEIIETQALVMLAEDWPGRPEASDPMWRPMDFDGLVVAIKTLS